jgi:hypothetical protein
MIPELSDLDPGEPPADCLTRSSQRAFFLRCATAFGGTVALVLTF